MSVRVPEIVERVIEQNGDLSASAIASLSALARELREGRPLPPLAWLENDGGFARALAARKGQGWLDTDWFFAETYAYRQLAERVDYFRIGRDPFLPIKLDEYKSASHRAAFERALELADASSPDLEALLLLSLFGNRIDLSFAASRAHGLDVSPRDLLADDRARALALLRERTGRIHVVADNAGTELTLDLVLLDAILRVLGSPVTLHVKVHPTFVSDATSLDVHRFVRSGASLVDAPSDACIRCLDRLAAALDDGRLEVREHWYWNGPESLWDMPEELARAFARARLVVLKGDANYRRALGDAVWPTTTPFAEAVAYFPSPLLALRTLKSDPVVGLREGEAERLEVDDPRWRFNGRRGVASLGGAGVTRAASGNT